MIQCKHVIYSALLFTISYFVHRNNVSGINIYVQGNLEKKVFLISACIKLSSSYLRFQIFYLTSEVMFMESSLPHVHEIVILILTFSDPSSDIRSHFHIIVITTRGNVTLLVLLWCTGEFIYYYRILFYLNRYICLITDDIKLVNS